MARSLSKVGFFLGFFLVGFSLAKAQCPAGSQPASSTRTASDKLHVATCINLATGVVTYLDIAFNPVPLLANGSNVVDLQTVSGGANFIAKTNSAITTCKATYANCTIHTESFIGAQNGTATLTIPAGVIVYMCGVQVTSTANPMVSLSGSGTLHGCSSDVADTSHYTAFILSGTAGDTGISMGGAGTLDHVAVKGISNADSSIGVDVESSSSLVNDVAIATFQTGMQWGVAGGTYYNGYQNVLVQGAQTAFLFSGNANSITASNLIAQTATTCLEMDGFVDTVLHVDCETISGDAEKFGGYGNTVVGNYIEGAPNGAHFTGAAVNNTLIGGRATGVSSHGILYDSNVSRTTNFVVNVSGLQSNAWPQYWGIDGSQGNANQGFFIGYGGDSMAMQLEGEVGFGGYSPAWLWSLLGTYASKYYGYAPFAFGALEIHGGFNLGGAVYRNTLFGVGSNPPVPTLACASSGTGTTYSFYLVAHGWTFPGNAGDTSKPSAAATIQCPNVPSVSFPVTVTPASTTNGVKGYDFLVGDTAHSFALDQVGAQSYTGTTSAYTAPTRDGTGDTTETAGSVHALAQINQVATKNFAGTCTMSTTTCTFTTSAVFAGTPVNFASDQTGTLAGKCVLSGTTVTITAASSNTDTWGCLLIGNPN